MDASICAFSSLTDANTVMHLTVVWSDSLRFRAVTGVASNLIKAYVESAIRIVL